MKKIVIAIIAISLTGTIACKKKVSDPVSRIVTASYPIITIKGDQFISIPVGGSFTDQGASAEDTVTNEQLEPIEVTNDIDPTTPGFYTVQYKFKNSNGYTNVATRFVLVTNVDSTLDYSGVYVRTTGTPTNVSKVAAGLYKTDNVGGVGTLNPNTGKMEPNPDFIYDVYFGQIDDTTLVFPNQPTKFGELYCVNSFIYPSATDTTIKYAVRNATFGLAVRTFIKSAQ